MLRHCCLTTAVALGLNSRLTKTSLPAPLLPTPSLPTPSLACYAYPRPPPHSLTPSLLCQQLGQPLAKARLGVWRHRVAADVQVEQSLAKHWRLDGWLLRAGSMVAGSVSEASWSQ